MCPHNPSLFFYYNSALLGAYTGRINQPCARAKGWQKPPRESFVEVSALYLISVRNMVLVLLIF